MFKQVSLLSLACLFSACSDSTNNSNSSTSSQNQLFGVWQWENEEVASDEYIFVINDSSATIYLYDENYQCYSSFEFSVINSSEDSLTLNDGDSSTTANYTVSENSLTLSAEGQQPVEYQRLANNPADNNLCIDEEATGQISARIVFSHLPDSFTFNNPATDDNTGEFAIRITFDTNLSGEVDHGDIEFNIHHFKEPNEPQREIALSELAATLSMYTDSSTTSWLSSIPFTAENKVVTFNVPLSSHIALEGINQATPVAIRAYYNGDTTYSSDDYPEDRGFTTGEDTSLLIDAEDESTSEPRIDISTIEISIED